MFTKVLDIYYRLPLIFDLLFNIVSVAFILFIESNGYYCFSFDRTSQVIPSIGITISGFVLTMLTILLTLKTNSIINKNDHSTNDYKNNFSIFLASDLYTKAISVLRNGVVFLLIISFVTLGISVVVQDIYIKYGVYLNTICIISTLLVFLRSFYVLNLIFKMQSPKS